jgi:hypothetical protein
MNSPTTPQRALTPEQAHHTSSFHANFSRCSPSLESLRDFSPSIPSTYLTEEMEEKEKCQQNSKIDQFLDLEQCYFDSPLQPIASVTNGCTYGTRLTHRG